MMFKLWRLPTLVTWKDAETKNCVHFSTAAWAGETVQREQILVQVLFHYFIWYFLLCASTLLLLLKESMYLTCNTCPSTFLLCFFCTFCFMHVPLKYLLLLFKESKYLSNNFHTWYFLWYFLLFAITGTFHSYFLWHFLPIFIYI